MITVTSMTYTGEQELCIKNISGNKTCLEEDESIVLDSDLTYYFELNPKSQEKNITSVVDFLFVLFGGLLLGIVLIVGTYLLLKTFMFN